MEVPQDLSKQGLSSTGQMAFEGFIALCAIRKAINWKLRVF